MAAPNHSNLGSFLLPNQFCMHTPSIGIFKPIDQEFKEAQAGQQQPGVDMTPLCPDTFPDTLLDNEEDALVPFICDPFFYVADELYLDHLLAAVATGNAASPNLNAKLSAATATCAPVKLAATAQQTKKTASTAGRRRRPKTSVPEEKKDARYRARRLRNTEAAARNRAVKRMQSKAEKERLRELANQQSELLDEVDFLNMELAALTALVREQLESL